MRKKCKLLLFLLHVVTFFLHEHEKGEEIGSGWLKKVEREKKTKEDVGF